MNEINFEKDEIQVIIFKIGKESYTAPINLVQEIIMPQKTTSLPQTSRCITGVINLRGIIVPIIDGRERFNLEPFNESEESRIIIFNFKNYIMGLVVDDVYEVIHIDTKDIEPSPIEEQKNSLIVGICKLENRLLIMLNPLNLIETQEAHDATMSVQSLKNLISARNIIKTNNILIESQEENQEAEIATRN